MGFSAFLGKMGISMNDRARATELLADYALSRCDRVAALRKLPAEIKPVVMRIMASYVTRIVSFVSTLSHPTL